MKTMKTMVEVTVQKGNTMFDLDDAIDDIKENTGKEVNSIRVYTGTIESNFFRGVTRTVEIFANGDIVITDVPQAIGDGVSSFRAPDDRIETVIKGEWKSEPTRNYVNVNGHKYSLEK